MATKSSGGFKSGITTVFMVLIIAGFLVSWARINGISDFAGGYKYFKSWSNKINKCTGSKVEWNCDSSLETGDGKYNNIPGSNNGKDNSKNDSSSNAKTIAINDLNSLKIGEAQQNVAYKRSEWKHWIGSPCNTREKVLIKQGKNVKYDAGEKCTVRSGTWISPYEDLTITDPKQIDIDHVIPLGYAAKHGGQAWSSEKKESFANDMNQLLATSATENRSKSDKGPAEYMPSNRKFQCQYSKIWVETAKKYGVSISAQDKNKLMDGLQKCE